MVVREELGVADDAGQGGPQLVADGRDELSLGAVELQHPLVGLPLLVQGEDQGLFGSATIGHVAHDAQVARGVSFVVGRRGHAHRDGEPAPVLADERPVPQVLVRAERERFGHHAVAGRDPELVRPFEELAALVERERGDPPDDLLGVVTEHLLRPGAEEGDQSLGVGGDEGGAARGVDELSELQLVLADPAQRVTQVRHGDRERGAGDRADGHEGLRAGGDGQGRGLFGDLGERSTPERREHGDPERHTEQLHVGPALREPGGPPHQQREQEEAQRLGLLGLEARESAESEQAHVADDLEDRDLDLLPGAAHHQGKDRQLGAEVGDGDPQEWSPQLLAPGDAEGHRRDRAGGGAGHGEPDQPAPEVGPRAQLWAFLVEAREPPEDEQCLDRVRDREPECERDAEAGVQAGHEEQPRCKPGQRPRLVRREDQHDRDQAGGRPPPGDQGRVGSVVQAVHGQHERSRCQQCQQQAVRA